MNFLKNFDIYPQSISFNIRKEQKYATGIGGILGISLIIIFIIFFVIFGLDCYKRTNPKVLQQSSSSPQVQKYDLVPGSFNISFTFYAFNENNVLNPVTAMNYDIQFAYITKVSKSRPTLFTKVYSPDNSTVTFKLISNVSLYDFFTVSDVFAYLQFGIGVCNLETFPACNLTTIKEQFINEAYISITIYTASLDFNNPQQPLTTIPQQFLIKMNYQTVKNLFYNFKKVEVKNDLGWLIPGIQYSSGIDIENFLDDFNGMNMDLAYNIPLFNGFLIFGREKNTYTITYMKIQDVLAQVGGLINVFNLIFSVFASFYGQNEIDNYLVNNMLKESFIQSGDKEIRRKETLDNKKNGYELSPIKEKKRII